MNSTDDFERQLATRLHDLADEVTPSDGLLERGRLAARRAVVANQVRRFAVPAAAVIMVAAVIGAAMIAATRDKETRTSPADVPTTTVKPTTTTVASTTTTSPPATTEPLPDPLAGVPDVDVVITPETRTQGELTYSVPTFAVKIDGAHSDAAQAIEADLASTVDSLASYSLHLDESRPILEFQVTALVAGSTDRSVSVRLEAYLMYNGAAHPGRRPATRTFDLGTGQPMTLEMLFQPATDYLGEIAAEAKHRLQAYSFASTSDFGGTEPTADNYSVWAVLPEGLEITFKEYQVAAYAFGEPAVVIPWSRLTAVLGAWTPSGLVAPWAGGELPFPNIIATFEELADQQFATATKLRSVRVVWSHSDPGHNYVVGLVLAPNHTVSPMAIQLGDPPTVVALGGDRFGCDTLPAEVIAQLFLPCE